MTNSEDILSPAEMRDWLRQEVRDLTKALELRVQDATEFVTSYGLGELTPTEAMDRLMKYTQRWGDSPIPDVQTTERMTNDEILHRIDAGVSPRLRTLRKSRGNEPADRNL